MNILKHKLLYLILALAIVELFSCKKYLDIVPPNTGTIEAAFENEASAKNFLFSLYSYMPTENSGSGTISSAATEEAVMVWQNNIISALLRGEQNSSNPLFNYWEGKNCTPAISSFEGIRQCYIFLDNIDKVSDISPSDKTRMKGEATFLVAYYHYLMLRQYGPIPIVTHVVDFNSANEADIYPERKPYDECINYIAGKFDEAAAMLPAKMPVQNELGRVSSVIAKSIKSRMLLTAASPLFNGNTEYYGNLKSKAGTPLMNLSYDKEKWKRAADAIKEAIDAAQQAGIRLYQFSDYKGPTDFFDNTPFNKGMIAHRMAMVDPWNVELIWGYSNPENSYGWQANCSPLNSYSYNGIGPSLKTVETYYTANGLPIDKDPDWDYQNRYNVNASAGTLNLNLNREPRYYASIAYDNGVYYINGKAQTVNFKAGEKEGWRSGATNYSATGFLIQKVVNPQTVSDAQNFTLVKYPWPIIRLAELYLSYAEALNEYYGETMQGDVLQNLNKIRERAGIPTVEAAWALSGHTGSFSQSEMRLIIRQERTIELAFEGHHFWDIRRWKLGDQYFNKTIYGMNIQGADENSFNQIKPILTPVFKTPANYLFPISVNELSKNKNLVQNPGW